MGDFIFMKAPKVPIGERIGGAGIKKGASLLCDALGKQSNGRVRGLGGLT